MAWSPTQVLWRGGPETGLRINGPGVLSAGTLPGPGLTCREQQGPFYLPRPTAGVVHGGIWGAAFPRVPSRRASALMLFVIKGRMDRRSSG